jgi:hypothetical protein
LACLAVPQLDAPRDVETIPNDDSQVLVADVGCGATPVSGEASLRLLARVSRRAAGRAILALTGALLAAARAPTPRRARPKRSDSRIALSDARRAISTSDTGPTTWNSHPAGLAEEMQWRRT